MPTIEIRSHVSLDDLVNGVSQLDTTELEQFIFQVLTLRAKRIAANLPQAEAGLFQKINQALPQEIQQRYDELTAKRQAETLTPEEHTEPLEIIDQIERSDAERAQALIELAQLRNVPVTTLMAELGIRSRPYA